MALGLLDDAKQLDLRGPHQDFFDPIWAQGWRAEDLVQIGSGLGAQDGPEPLPAADGAEERAAS